MCLLFSVVLVADALFILCTVYYRHAVLMYILAVYKFVFIVEQSLCFCVPAVCDFRV